MIAMAISQPTAELIPWGILAVAVAMKIWRLAGLMRAQWPRRPTERELQRVRASLERVWNQDITA